MFYSIKKWQKYLVETKEGCNFALALRKQPANIEDVKETTKKVAAKLAGMKKWL